MEMLLLLWSFSFLFLQHFQMKHVKQDYSGCALNQF